MRKWTSEFVFKGLTQIIAMVVLPTLPWFFSSKPMVLFNALPVVVSSFFSGF